MSGNMKQVVFLIDTSWLHDEETTIAVRFSCLQILTAWPSSTCKYGYMLFSSEGPRTQKVEPAPFNNPTTVSVEEFETRLTEGLVGIRSDSSEASQLETIRWAVSRSVTDFAWHSVSVTSPVKASRKKRQAGIIKQEEQECRNMLFLFSRLPSGTLSRIRDELITSSLNKCLQENKIELFWVHDSVESSSANSSKCVFLRMRDLIHLCGVFFPSEQLQYTASLAPRSKIVAFLLQRQSKPQPLASCSLVTDRCYNPIELSVFSNQSCQISVKDFESAGLELQYECLLENPSLTSMLSKCVSIYIVTSRDVHFHRLLMELQSIKCAAVLICGKITYVLKPVADSVATLIHVIDKTIAKCSTNESSTKIFDSIFIEDGFKTELNLPSNFQLLDNRLSRLQEAYKNLKPIKGFENNSIELRATVQEKLSPKKIRETYNSESSLLEQMQLTFDRAVDNKISLISSAQSIVSATVHFFESDFEKAKTFLESHFPVPLKSDRDNDSWANECRIFILISFELASLNSSSGTTDIIKKNVITAMRKLLFLTAPSKLFDFIRETLKSLYLENVRSLLEELAEEFDLPLFADSDEETEKESSFAGSFAEPLSGISSLGASIPNSITRSQPVTKTEPSGDSLRRVSSVNLSQRQIQMPRRKSTRVIQQEKPKYDLSPTKMRLRDMPTTPRGKRILKTQVVPETPISKQAPDRVRRNQERLRRRSSILTSPQAEDNIMEVEESPVKGQTPRCSKQTPSKSATKKELPKATPEKTPTKNRKSLTRKLKFSPQKKAFSSPTAISLLHLTTSPVLYKPPNK